MKKRFILVIIILFIILAGIFYAMQVFAPAYNTYILQTGNILMALLSILTYYIVTKQIKNRPQAFVRGVYSSSFLKLTVCMVAILAYVLANRANLHKPTLFSLFGIYAVYSIAETWMLSRLAKEK